MSDPIPTSEAKYRLLVEGAIDYAMILMDTDGRVTGWNAGAEQILGWTEEEMLDQPADLIFTPEDRMAGVPESEMAQARSDGRALDLRWHMKKDGSRFFADGIMERLRDDGGQERGFAKIMRDATQQGERTERERFLAELAERARVLTDPDAVIVDAVRSVGQFLGVGRCVFGDIDLLADTCTIVADYCADDSVRSIVGAFPFSEFGPFVVAEYRAGRAVSVEDVRLDPVRVTEPNVSMYESIGIRSHITVPVVHSSRLVSVMAVHHPTPRQWKPEEMEMLQTVMERTWLTVEVLRQQLALAREAQERIKAHERTSVILESITDAFFAIDRDWRFTYLNDQAERVLLRPRAELLGHNLWEEFPAARGTHFERHYRRAMTEQVAVTFEEYYPLPLDAWFEVRAYPSPDGLSVYFHDFTARKRGEEERERLLAETEQRAKREALINRVNEALRITTDPEEIQRVAVVSLGEALNADRCYFSQFDLAADLNWIGQDFHSSDLPSLAGHYRISDFQVRPEDYYPNERTLVVADAMAENWSFPEVLLTALRQLRVRSSMTTPIFDQGRLVATLSVAMADEPRAWTDNEVKLMEAVAAQTRSAVETARLRAEQQNRLQEEALIGRIGVAIRSELDPDAIQEQAAALVGEALGVSRCFYLTYDASRDAAHAGRDYHRDDLPSLAGDYRLSDFAQMLTELFRTGATAVISDVHAALSPAVAEGMLSSQNRALLAVPFFDGERLVAALWASMDEPRIWTAHEIALIEQAATLTRTALETARVSRKERAIAQQLQEALQPVVPAHLPGLSLGSFTRPALDEASVGGDFMDVFVLDKEQYAIVIGDVSGKGLAAAQQLALIRNTLRTLLYLNSAPAQAVATLNSIVTAHDLLVGFVTAWVGVYDVATSAITFCSCGHEPALVQRANGSVEALFGTNPPLGMAEQSEYVDQRFTLGTGDALLLYTDGISEAGPSRRDLLGTDGLIRLLAALPTDHDAQWQAERLVTEVSAFANGAFRDDVAVLLARCQSTDAHENRDKIER